jgi:thiol-disulfide isomerase/thioredoxin
MSKRNLRIAGIILAIPLALLAWWLISPLFISRTVDEPFPATTASSTNDEVAIPPSDDTAMEEEPTDGDMTEGESSMMEETPADDDMAEGEESMVEEESMDGEMMEGEDSTMEESGEEEMMEGEDSTMEDAMDGEMTEEETMAEPVTYPLLLTDGQFYPLEHAVQGTARIYELEDGSRVLRFEEFLVDNGPDLAVWLVPQETVPNVSGTVPEGYYELARLKGNKGNQNYEIPADLDLSQFKSVLVWCVTFSVPFAAAPLQSVMMDDTMMEEDSMMESEESNMSEGDTVLAESEPAPDYDPIPLTVELQDLGTAPEITNDTWINADAPVRLADLRGKVVVVEFWTYGCYNCQNVLPYIKAWDAKYAGDDFEVVSVHYPEFTFERDINNVRAAVQEADIQYPVAIDNDGVTWRAYNQRFWPVWYVVDKEGIIRYKHIGEGGYTETEGVIQALLAE